MFGLLCHDADRLRTLDVPTRIEDGPRTTQLWHGRTLTSFPTPGRPVRVVSAEERTSKRQHTGAASSTRGVKNRT